MSNIATILNSWEKAILGYYENVNPYQIAPKEEIEDLFEQEEFEYDG